MKQENELYVDVTADGKWTAWTFRGGDVIQFAGNKHQYVTRASIERITQLTYNADKLSVQLLAPNHGHLTFVISDWQIAARKAADGMPSPKALPQGLCNAADVKFVSDEECLVLATSIGLARGEKGFEIAEVLKIVKWAENIRFSDALLEAVLAGYVIVDVDEKGELVFKAGEDPDGIQQ